MRKAKKTLLAAACALALVVGSVAGTVAYLTAKDTVTNTFTVGSVAFSEKGLDEAKVNDMGEPVSNDNKVVDQDKAPRVKGNTYKLLPGHTYVKDPTVHMKTGSEPAWVFVKVENGLVKTVNGKTVSIEAAAESVEGGYKAIAAQIADNGWTQLKDKDGNEVAGVYYKDWSEVTSPSNLDLPVFGKFKVAADADVSSYADATIKVTAYAIQKDGFDVNAAWNEVSKLDTTTA